MTKQIPRVLIRHVQGDAAHSSWMADLCEGVGADDTGPGRVQAGLVMGRAAERVRGCPWRGLVAVLMLVVGPVFASAGGNESLCEDGETSYFACSGDNFAVSVCADKGFPSRKTFIHFRKQGREDVVIDIPGIRSNLPRAVKGQILSVRGGGAYMRFDAGKNSFVIYGVGARYGVGRVVDGMLRAKTQCVGQTHADFAGVPLPSGDVFAVSGL